MTYHYFSRNEQILSADQAVARLDSLELTYGFGVYESVRVLKGTPYFLGEHVRRLLDSAAEIGLEHTFSRESVATACTELIAKNAAENCNLKILLIGGGTPEEAELNILCLNPRYPDRKLYKDGAHVITVELERPFPHAKTLNMLPSYLAYRNARAAGAYDALLVNRHGCITEGTGSNFFALKNRTIHSPKTKDILLGVTRDNLLKVAARHRFKVVEKDIELSDLKYYDHYDNLFLTSTSAKIMPIRSVDKHDWGTPNETLRELMQAFDDFLDRQQS